MVNINISKNKSKVQSCRQLNDNVCGIHSHISSYIKSWSIDWKRMRTVKMRMRATGLILEKLGSLNSKFCFATFASGSSPFLFSKEARLVSPKEPVMIFPREFSSRKILIFLFLLLLMYNFIKLQDIRHKGRGSSIHNIVRLCQYSLTEKYGECLS